MRDFCGHGVGSCFTTSQTSYMSDAGRGHRPQIICSPSTDDQSGRPHVKVLSDGWTAVTRDRSLSAQFEHSVGVTNTGVEIFLSRRAERQPLCGELTVRTLPISHIDHPERIVERTRGKPPEIRGSAAALSAIATRLRSFARSGRRPRADYELLELLLFRGIPRRYVKPLARRCSHASARFRK